MNGKTRFLVLSLLLALALAWGLMANLSPREVSADAVTNYNTTTWSAGATTYITTGGDTGGKDVSGYGSAVIHVINDGSTTTSTLTVTPMYSNQTVNCTVATDWFTGTDYIFYSDGAVGALSQVVGAEISYTVNTTAALSLSSTGSTTITSGGLPYVITSTYTYHDPVTYTVQAAISAGAGSNSLAQAFTVSSDTYTGREVRVYGRCMMLDYGVSNGTITPTTYVMTRDFYEN